MNSQLSSPKGTGGILPKHIPLCRLSMPFTCDDISWFVKQISTAREEEIGLFEQEFAQHQGLPTAFFVNSASAGLYEVLQAMNLPPKSRILMPAWTHPAMPAAVVAAGHYPRLMDVDEGTWTMGSAALDEDIWDGTGAILITHMYGCPAPMQVFMEQANKRRIPILEDCSKGLGADCGGSKAGENGVASFYSFGLTDNLSTLGGGMIGVRGPALADKLTKSREQCKTIPNGNLSATAAKAFGLCLATTKYGFILSGYPLLALGWYAFGRDLVRQTMPAELCNTAPPRIMTRPAACQAALGRRLLKRLDQRNQECNRRGRRLIELLTAKNIKDLGLPQLPARGTHIFTDFVITYPNRDWLSRLLLGKGVDSGIDECCAVNLLDALATRLSLITNVPIAKRLNTEQLHLPLYPELTEEQLQNIADNVAECCQEIEAQSREGVGPNTKPNLQRH